MSNPEETGPSLPEWSEADQQRDYEAIRVEVGKERESLLRAADIVARIIPLGVSGVNAEIGKRTEMLAQNTGNSVGQIKVLRSVGSRWLPEYRDQTASHVVNFTAIKSACGKEQLPHIDPVKVLVKSILNHPKDRAYSIDDFDEAMKAANEALISRDEGIGTAEEDRGLSFDDMLPPEPIEEPYEESETDQLVAEVKRLAGRSKADQSEGESAARELMMWLAQSPRVLSRIKSLSVNRKRTLQPIRKTIIVFVKSLIKDLGITDDELNPADPSKDG